MALRTGLVVARFRNTVEVERGDRRSTCLLKGKRLSVVVGDRVRVKALGSGQAAVTEVLPRSTQLTRVNSGGRAEVVAANIDHVVAVVAPRPPADWFLVDRYLCAAELTAVAATVVLNKADLAGGDPPGELEAYRQMDYAVLVTSAKEGSGLSALAGDLAGRRSVLVGQSGVGKSSLLNAIVPAAAERVAELSAKTNLGRHTTSTAVLHRLPGSGELIDSPGVRDYAPFIDDPLDIRRGFREFAPYPSQCRFADCRHLEEPDCAVKDAVAAGQILERRYLSFVRLYRLAEELAKARAPR